MQIASFRANGVFVPRSVRKIVASAEPRAGFSACARLGKLLPHGRGLCVTLRLNRARTAALRSYADTLNSSGYVAEAKVSHSGAKVESLEIHIVFARNCKYPRGIRR